MTDSELYKNLPDKLNQLLAFFNNTSDCIIICDCDFIINYVNPAYTKLTGFKAKEVLGKNYQDSNPNVVDKILDKKNWAKILKGKTISISIACNKKNGEEYFLEKSIIPVHFKTNTGNITHLIFIGKNITQQTKTLNTLTKNEKTLEDA